MCGGKLALHWQNFVHGKRTKGRSKQGLKLPHTEHLVQPGGLTVIVAIALLELDDGSFTHDELWIIRHARLQPLFIQFRLHLPSIFINYYN